MNSSSVELLDRLCANQGNCSDYRAAKLLSISRTTVSHWRSGRFHMSDEVIAKACALAGEPLLEWLMRIQSERSPGELGTALGKIARDLQRARAGEAGALTALLGRKIAAITLIAGAATGVLHPSPAQAVASASAEATSRGLYIMFTRRRRRSRHRNAPRRHLAQPRRRLFPLTA